ncbi:hypothetical protein [Streptococcus sp. X13SY08]|uniref:hypothetical protein n=1 Tax=Streptococcus sp. X13SY08 TaxID=1676616 RepID=UPI000B1458BE|nr:hypothetical protein [Streptococcus sp. X13SY08]
MPAELVGTFSGESLQAKDVSITISADGAVSTTAHFIFDGVDEIKESQAQIKTIVAVAPNIYRIDDYDGLIDAIQPGITGLGGTGFVAYVGFKIENDTLTPIAFVAPTAEEIPSVQPTDLGVNLTRN